MTYRIISPTQITTSLLLLTCTYSMTAMAAEVVVNDAETVIIDDSNDLASELVKREGQSTVLESTVPTARVNSQEIREAMQRRSSTKASQGYDLETLQADPLLFTKYLNGALAAQDMTTVKKLLPYYKALDKKDPVLIQFADALVYRSNQQNKQAIEIYKSMLAQNPQFNPVRLNLAQTLYADKQYLVAEEQLQKLKSSELPEPVMKQVEGLLNRIQRQEEWRFNASVSYIDDDNLNDAPSTAIQTSLGRSVEQESGRGVQISARATKRNNLPNNFYSQFGANASLKGYFGDASDYNDYLLTASAGLGYDDAKNDVSVTPFITHRIYSEDPYSWRKGVTLKGSRWVNPKLKLTATGVFSNEKFEDEKDKYRETDGRFYGLNALYTLSPEQYIYGGIGTYENDVPNADVISYDRNSINVGWGREWQQGISTLATAGYGVKEYEDVSDTYPQGSFYYQSVGGEYGDNREDKTTSLGLQVWKRDLTFYGLTPRLVFDYDKTTSNYDYYDDRDDKSATVLLSKSF